MPHSIDLFSTSCPPQLTLSKDTLERKRFLSAILLKAVSLLKIRESLSSLTRLLAPFNFGFSSGGIIPLQKSYIAIYKFPALNHVKHALLNPLGTWGWLLPYIINSLWEHPKRLIWRSRMMNPISCNSSLSLYVHIFTWSPRSGGVSAVNTNVQVFHTSLEGAE